MQECCICNETFQLTNCFEITSETKTGIQCKFNEGHYICNICFLIIYPKRCPLCSENLKTNDFHFPVEILEYQNAHEHEYQSTKQQLEDCEVILHTQEEELGRVRQMEEMMVGQNAMLLMMQVFGGNSSLPNQQTRRHVATRRRTTSRGSNARIQ